MCWQAAGNGSPVTLKHCPAAAEGQQWTLAGHGGPAGVLMSVLMNGNGYCLQAGPPLVIGFDGQCDGHRGGVGWGPARRDGPGKPTRRPREDCAVRGGPLVPRDPESSPGPARGDAVEPGSGVIPPQPAGLGPAAGDTGAGGAPRRRCCAAGALPGARPVAGAGAAGGGLAAAARAGRVAAADRGDAGVLRAPAGPRAGHRADGAGPGGRHPDDDGPYVVDVTDEVAGGSGRGVVDSRPTEPFDASPLQR